MQLDEDVAQPLQGNAIGGTFGIVHEGQVGSLVRSLQLDNNPTASYQPMADNLCSGGFWLENVEIYSRVVSGNSRAKE